MADTPFEILLTTVNARYQHSSFGLRYLFANMGDLQPQTQILEFVLGKNPRDIVEVILQQEPKIVGFGVYIWNTTVISEVVSILKLVAPDIRIVLGGPEVSYESHLGSNRELWEQTDFVIKGEADLLFAQLCRQILSGQAPNEKLISGELPDLTKLYLPYAYYTPADIANRVIYVEASRGCPYKCEYCLSSLDTSVRNFPIAPFLQQMQQLLDQGVRQFKFVDRTFNLSPTLSLQILDFFAQRVGLGLFLHFEMVPDRLPAELREKIAQFPAGSLQFEIGIQTWNPVVAAHVSRRQNYGKIIENLRFLKASTGVHTHADLIIGLPGETLESFAHGFDQLAHLSPDEIQVGLLKRLKGAPIARHEKEFQMRYNSEPPFALLQNRDLDYGQIQKMQRFAQYWDLVANSGNFPLVNEYLHSQTERFQNSLFWTFWDLSRFLFARHGQTHAISRSNLAQSLRDYLLQEWQCSVGVVDSLFQKAATRSGLHTVPERQRKHLEQARPEHQAH